jgi:predicted phage terminase large subunit-like protein
MSQKNEPDESPPFREWLERISPYWKWDWRHQLYLYDRLAAMTAGDKKRLMIFMPPRHGKSETVTVHYAAYRLQRKPIMNIIIGCYNQKLANRFSRRIRRICESGVDLSKERRAAEEWETTAGGGVRAVGVGAGVTGFGAGLIIIDDPVKSRAHAESVTIRENTADWFNDDIYTRLEPGGEIIIIQTRWHEDDLSGRLLREMEESEKSEDWEVVKIPALAETDDPLGRAPGEALCPERFSAEDLSRIRNRIGSRSFESLYQQSPFPEEGSLFKRGWFRRYVDRAPAGLKWFRGYDLAVSTKTSADHTASFRCALDEKGDLYIADGFRGRLEYPEQRRYVIERMIAEPDTQHCIESALHGKALVQDLRRVKEICGIPLREAKALKDKFTRALGWAALAEAGKIVLVRGPWNREFLDEVCRFTGRNDREDDQIDAVSIAVNMIRESGGRRSAGF